MPDRNRAILVIEDDRTLNRLICDNLERLGHSVLSAGCKAAALEQLARFQPEVALLDVRLPDANGLDFLPELARTCPVIVLTAYGSIDQAVTAVRTGAVDYLVKPISEDALAIALDRVFQNAAIQRDLARWRSHAARSQRADLIGQSPAMTELRRLVSLIAPSDAPVLLRGEGGSGKGVVAAAIHAHSARANGRLIRVNCGTDMASADLFGTNGTVPAQREGLLAAAEHGTAYLNDIEKLSAPMQDRLNAFMEGQQGLEDRTEGVRIVAATSVNPAAAIADGTLNSDLYYRLATVVLDVPPLRDRPEDIPDLTQAIIDQRSFQRHIAKQLSDEAIALLGASNWPGNIRQLANTIERGIILSGTREEITPEDLGLNRHHGAATGGDGVSLSFDHRPTLEELRASYIQRLLVLNDENRHKTARDLGISERNLYRLLKG